MPKWCWRPILIYCDNAIGICLAYLNVRKMSGSCLGQFYLDPWFSCGIWFKNLYKFAGRDLKPLISKVLNLCNTTYKQKPFDFHGGLIAKILNIFLHNTVCQNDCGTPRIINRLYKTLYYINYCLMQWLTREK